MPGVSSKRVSSVQILSPSQLDVTLTTNSAPAASQTCNDPELVSPSCSASPLAIWPLTCTFRHLQVKLNCSEFDVDGGDAPARAAVDGPASAGLVAAMLR
jgi:hypothetical protein